MIQEAYCSYEVSKLLKEKGFNEPCNKKYNGYKSLVFAGKMTELWSKNSEFDINEECSAPTQQIAMKWLREEKSIIINVWYDGGDWNAEYYNNKDENFHLITCLCNSYEQAVEAALKYCLKNLI